MQFERGVLTTQGISLMNTAKANDQLVFTKFLFTEAEFEPSKDLTDLPTPTWGNGHATGAVSGSSLSVYLEATNKDDWGYMRGYGVWGHLESKASEGDVLLMTAKAIPPITQVTEASGAWTVFRLTLTIAYEVGEGSVTITPSYTGYVSDIDFQKFSERCVTTHAEGSTTTGDDQDVLGVKNFLDTVEMHDLDFMPGTDKGLRCEFDYNSWNGRMEASGANDAFVVNCPLDIATDRLAYNVVATTTNENDLIFELKNVTASATNYALYVSGGFVLNFENTSDEISYSPTAFGEGVGALNLGVAVVTVDDLAITTRALGTEMPIIQYNEDGITLANVRGLYLRADDGIVIDTTGRVSIGDDTEPEVSIYGAHVDISADADDELVLAGHKFNGICQQYWEPYSNRMWEFECYVYARVQDDGKFLTYVTSTHSDLTPCTYLEEGTPANAVSFVLGGLSMSSGSAIFSCIFAPRISFPSVRNDDLYDYSYLPATGGDIDYGRVTVKSGRWTLKEVYSDLLNGLGNDTTRAYNIYDVNHTSGVYWLLVVKQSGTYRFFK